ncbi:hypothetical protein GS622_21505 [Ruegeria sp. HKCCD6109]|nr:hypothetical protein [Ruegeria sp. HKCCD6109]
MASDQILRGAILSGLINAVINGIIQYFILRGTAPIPLTLDSISGGSHSVLGGAVLLAVSLAMILTAVAHVTVKGPKKPFVPTTLRLVFKHGLVAFGTVVALAVLWQWAFGTVEVGLVFAVILLGLIAGVVAAAVNYLTIVEVTGGGGA